MNIAGWIKNRSKLLFFLLSFLIFITDSNLYSAAQYESWGIPKETVLKKYVSAGEDISEFTPVKNPEYDNKIMNMVKLILKNVESDVDKEILIISLKSNPKKDFLLFRNKLFSVMELYNSLSKEELSTVIKKLSEKYGEPNFNTGEGLETYFISNKTTKIIVHYYIKTKKCEVYFYDSQLYHKLSTNEY